MSLDLPIDQTVDLTNGSYKNPGRLLVRSQRPRIGWVVWFGVNGKAWPVGPITLGNEGTALVFGGTNWRGLPWDGQGQEPEGGPNVTLAAASGGLATYDEIRAADKYVVWAVAPDGLTRSLAWETDNDIYITTETAPNGRTPKKTRRSVIRGAGVPYPPGYEPTEPPPGEPVPDPILDTVKEVRAKYPTPLPNEDCGKLLNEVAWKERADGWGLAAKDWGAHSTQPVTGIKVSRDLLIHKASNEMYDVLADVGNKARPVWQSKGQADIPWVAPVDAGGTEPPPDDEYEKGYSDAIKDSIAALEELKR